MRTSTDNALALIRRYFDLAPSADTAAYFAQFADDAVVLDDGAEYRGLAAIEAWRTSVPAVSYTVDDVKSLDDKYLAAVDIAGDFPGSPVRLTFTFEFSADDRLTALTIRPRTAATRASASYLNPVPRTSAVLINTVISSV